jgi:hypothetical protein
MTQTSTDCAVEFAAAISDHTDYNQHYTFAALDAADGFAAIVCANVLAEKGDPDDDYNAAFSHVDALQESGSFEFADFAQIAPLEHAYILKLALEHIAVARLPKPAFNMVTFAVDVMSGQADANSATSRALAVGGAS